MKQRHHCNNIATAMRWPLPLQRYDLWPQRWREAGNYHHEIVVTAAQRCVIRRQEERKPRYQYYPWWFMVIYVEKEVGKT